MDPFVGEIRPVAFNFDPRGWAFCSGQLINISQNTALFSLLGTSFGGNGTSNFALPNLQGRIAVGQGQGPGLGSYDMGQQDGFQTVTLQPSQLPVHSHPVVASSAAANSLTPTGKFPAKAAKLCYAPSSTGNLSPDAVIPDGGGQAHNNMQPFATINYIIALQGIFPPRP